MGNLPEPCVNLSPPFFHTDIDYAGPFGILPFVGRGQRKHYIALFICLATKTIHLEIVEDYTTAGFLAAFRRFVSRRDLTAHMYSGNGPNFHGADREVQTSFQAIRTDSTLQASLANDGVQWHFIPSAAPHFGRFWEAGVKSLKFHLRWVMGSRTLSKAEFATLLCQIEACLNSRPMTALIDDPSDLSALTPFFDWPAACCCIRRLRPWDQCKSAVPMAARASHTGADLALLVEGLLALFTSSK